MISQLPVSSRVLLAVVSVAFGAPFCTPASAAESKLNVILIVIDDYGWADSSCYGSKFHRTPNIDKLASEGMRFTDAYAACPVCSPTRASVMTGKYPARLHLTDWLPGRADNSSQKLLRPKFRQQLPLEEVTLAEAFHDAGYVSGHIGKWHLGGEGFDPLKQGFDFNIAGDHTGTPLSYFAPFQRNQRFMPGLEEAPEGEYLTDRLAAEAEKFVVRNKDQPFLLYLPHFAVHTPLRAKPELIEKYETAPKPAGRQNNPIYAAMVESMDAAIGRVMQAVTDTGIAERTIIVLTSDNGGLVTAEGRNAAATSNAPLREGKGYLYDGGIRVPLIVKWPGRARPGAVSTFPVASIDLFPTLLEICGIKSDARPDGVSLVPLLRQSSTTLRRDALYWHYPHYANQGGKPGGAIRAGDFKLIEFYETGRRELFNIRRDPGESQNLADQARNKVEELSTALSEWRRAVGAQMPEPNPDFLPNPQADDGTITLPAKTADVHGTMLRYEPIPQKNTLGFWTRVDDWASWEFEIKKPGRFQLEILVGCGTGSGGSQVDFVVAGQTLNWTVKETGGFQNFVGTQLGQVTLKEPGRYTLTVKPRAKPGQAVMDLREVKLVPEVP